MKIYMAGYQFFEDSGAIGYFLEESKAEECCKYLNRTSRCNWDVYEFDIDETDYKSLNKELDEQERIKAEKEFKMEQEAALAEIVRLIAKYNLKEQNF